ncbi:MAG: Clp protease ClpP [Paludibacterium sp.]|nr:Clp protease ClpP [Paludibacterium sp.]MBV8646619.1 Clp protease ClpP [Paludibacterium sp.]
MAAARDDDDAEPEALPLFKRYESQGVARQISFYLSGEIGEPIHYTDLLYTLRSASSSDLILLHLNTPGGNFDTGLQIINNISASEAHVLTVLEARAYSMGAMIFLAGDELIVHDTCQLMFHNYSSALFGKGNEQQAQVGAVSKWFGKVMRQVCRPFLTDEEVDHILHGEDIWMDSDDIRRRLAHLQKGEPSVAPSAKRRLTAQRESQPAQTPK